MAKIYTKTGDKGQTSLLSGTRVHKFDSRLDTYGTIDELNSCIGIIRALLDKENLNDNQILTNIQQTLRTIQNELFIIGSQLACDDENLLKRIPPLKATHVEQIEFKIDYLETHLSLLQNFILPSGSLISCQIHLARNICRRAERLVVLLSHQVKIDENIIVYLNRTSDYLFVAARAANQALGYSDEEWEK